MKIAGIILAGGKGTRINSHKVNKVALPFAGKPLIRYGVDLLKGVCTPIVVVIGAFSHSVKEVLKKDDVIYALQRKRLGTAHAANMGMKRINELPTLPDSVVIGYGDHMMFYKKETIKKMIDLQSHENAAISLLTTENDKAEELAWGRIIRDKNGSIVGIIEQKDATEEQRKIIEINPGFYSFDYNFIAENINKVKKSEVSGEYYLTDLLKIAISQGKKIIGLKVPFAEVGIGINKSEELQISQEIYLRQKNKA